jgi:hypothetical protein
VVTGALLDWVEELGGGSLLLLCCYSDFFRAGQSAKARKNSMMMLSSGTNINRLNAGANPAFLNIFL